MSVISLKAARIDSISQSLEKFIEDGQLAGVATLIAQDGEIIHGDSHGYRNINSNIPIKLDTIFRIFSMTKPIVSAALMILYEQGKFDTQDPLSNFIPEYKNIKVFDKSGKHVDARNEIAIVDLLTHSAGLTYGDSGNQILDDHYEQADLFNEDISLKEMVQRIANLPLMYHPGEGWHYGVATDVIGHLIEILSGMRLENFLKEKIFEPLGMTDTGYFVQPHNQDRLSVLYTLNSEDKLVEVDDSIGGSYTKEIQLHPGGSGLVSTLIDYYKFCQMLQNYGKYKGDQILSSNTIKLMTRNSINESLFPISYNGLKNEPLMGIGFGLGFRVITNINHSGLMGNDGSYGWGGMANTMFWVDPKEKLIAILMAQCTTDDVHPIRPAFHSLVYESIKSS